MIWIFCVTETWLLSYDVATVGASLPGSYSFLHVPRLTGTKAGGVGLIYGGGGGGGGGTGHPASKETEAERGRVGGAAGRSEPEGRDLRCPL